MDKPPKGTAFKISDTEAFLVSSPPPFKGSTPRPLQNQNGTNFPCRESNSFCAFPDPATLWFRKRAALTVTIHYSDKIAELSLLGIKPKIWRVTHPFGYEIDQIM